MYCPSCNSYNDDNNRFCASCGAPLHKQQTEQPEAGSWEPQQTGDYQQSYAQSYQQSYQQPYQQPYQGAYQPGYAPLAEPTKPVTSTRPIVALILNIVFFNFIGLIFAVLSFVNYNNYTSERNRGGIELAEAYKRKCKTYATVADVLAILTLLFILAAIAAAVIFGLVSVSGGAPDLPFDPGNLPQDFFGMID